MLLGGKAQRGLLGVVAVVKNARRTGLPGKFLCFVLEMEQDRHRRRGQEFCTDCARGLLLWLTMRTTCRINAGIRQNQPFDGFAAQNVRFDDLVDIGHRDAPIPHRVGINDQVGPMFALVQTAGFIRSDPMFQATIGQLLLEYPLQFASPSRITGWAGTAFGTLVNTDKDVLLELRHREDLIRMAVGGEGPHSPGSMTAGRDPSTRTEVLAQDDSASCLLCGAAGVLVDGPKPAIACELRNSGNRGTLHVKEPLLAIVFEAHELRHAGAHRS